MTLALREYQNQAITSVIDYWSKGGGNPLVSMATGTGKSVVIAKLVRDLREMNSSIRFLCLVHTKELVAQNAQTLLKMYPNAPIGINSAGLGKRDRHQAILFASIQSVHKEDGNSLGPRDVILIDECHLVPKAGDGMYRNLLDKLRRTSPDLRVSGFTATPYRMDSGRLDKGPDRLFDDLAFHYGIAEGIRDGYLSHLRSPATALKMDVSGVQRRGGEFVPGSLEVAIDKDWITRGAVDEMMSFGGGRKSWLAFCAGVAHSEHVRDEIRSRGISCEMVTGDTLTGERDRIIRDFKAGRIQCLTNAQVLTTGFDAPAVDMVAMLRPTLSAGLYTQIVGRGTRLAPGKDDCLVLDFAGNVRRHGPVDTVEGANQVGSVSKIKAELDEVRAKECPHCKELVALNTRTCPVCSHVWPSEDKPKHEAVADSTLPILSTEAPAWIAVDGVRYFKHNKPEAPPSMRVEYACGIATHRCWICFEHNGYARQKAEAWWRQNATGPVPATIEEALARQAEINCPGEIRVKANGRYFEIVGYRTLRRDAA